MVFNVGEVDENIFDCPVIGRCGPKEKEMGSHTFALTSLLSYFQAHEYENYLILDSDCWPVRKGWLELLLKKMGQFPFAAPYRIENLDLFPHPSAFFIKGQHIRDNRLDFQRDGLFLNNLLNISIADVGSSVPASAVFPLIRSNRKNPHPVFSAIYYDIFYHHGCGSRVKRTRTDEFNYYGHMISFEESIRKEEELYDLLVKNPRSFIETLRN